MNGAATGAAVATIGVIEAYFKDYLICCEYLKLDPRIDYSLAVIKARTEVLLQAHKELDERAKRRLEKRTNWFLRNYKKLTGRWFGFPKRCEKLLKKDMLLLHEGTIQEEISSFELTQKNYDFFADKEIKYVLVGSIIVGGAILFLITALLLVFL